MTISAGELILRLVVAAVLCGAIGLEREARDQVAGLRTHILVGVGATLFTLVSAYGFASFIGSDRASTNVTFDPTRISAQIVTGIGFLGAGAIIRQGFNVRGLTTAASLWAAAAIGLAVGAGYFLGAVSATVIVLIVLLILRALRPRFRQLIRTSYGTLHVDLTREASAAAVFGSLVSRGVGVRAVETEQEGERQRLSMHVRLPPGAGFAELVEELGGLPGVTRAGVSGLDEHDELHG